MRPCRARYFSLENDPKGEPLDYFFPNFLTGSRENIFTKKLTKGRGCGEGGKR